MSANIINSHRYKKTTRKKANENKERIKANQKYKKEKLKNLKEKRKNEVKDSYIKLNNNFNSNYNTNLNNNTNKNKKKTRKHNFPGLLKIIGLVACIALIAIISRIIVKKENEPVVQADFNTEKKVSLVQDYNFKIGMSKLDSTNYLNSKNIILNELVSS